MSNMAGEVNKYKIHDSHLKVLLCIAHLCNLRCLNKLGVIVNSLHAG